MKIALIDSMPLLNKGFTIYLQRQKKVSLVKSYSKFEKFISFYSDVDKYFFDLFIVNLSAMNPSETERIIRLISTFFTRKDKLVLIVNKLSDLSVESIESEINIVEVTDSIDNIGEYIEVNY